jgi:hypothetical protein
MVRTVDRAWNYNFDRTVSASQGTRDLVCLWKAKLTNLAWNLSGVDRQTPKLVETGSTGLRVSELTTLEAIMA